MILDHLQNFWYVVDREKSFQEWCNTWGPFRSRRVSDRAEDSRPPGPFGSHFPLPEPLRGADRGRVTYLNYLINYLINRLQVDFPYLRLRGDRKGFPSKRDLLGCPYMLSTKWSAHSGELKSRKYRQISQETTSFCCDHRRSAVVQRAPETVIRFQSIMKISTDLLYLLDLSSPHHMQPLEHKNL